MLSQQHQVQEIKETVPLNLTHLLPQKFTPQTHGVKIDQFKKHKQTKRVSQITGRQRNDPLLISVLKFISVEYVSQDRFFLFTVCVTFFKALGFMYDIQMLCLIHCL